MFPEQDISISIYLASIVNKYYSGRNSNLYKDKFWYDLGYKTSGILYLGLTLWLIDRMVKNNSEKLYLMSRDGYIIKKIYDLISDNNKELPPAEYLYSSRRAFYIPSITELNDEALKFLMNPLSNDLSVLQYLERINLNPDLYKDKIEKAGFSSKENNVKTEEDYKKLKQLYIMLEDDILKQAEKEREILVKYFLQCDLLNNKVINIFDLGWYGSIQRGFKKLINLINDKNINIKGYYLGTHPVSADLNTESYIINCGYPEEQFRILHSNTKVLESFFNAPHGSVLGFYEENNEVKPLFDDIKFESSAIEKMSVLQKGAIDFAIDFLYLKTKIKSIKISKYLAISPMIRLLNKPTCNEAVRIGNLEHFDAFGKISTKRYIAKPSLNLLSFFLNPIQFLQNFRYNKITYWKTGYIKRLSRSDLILELAKNLWYNSTCIKKFIYKKYNK